jgi:hypothetical protein
MASAAPRLHLEGDDSLVGVEHAPAGRLADPAQPGKRELAEQPRERGGQPLGTEAADLLVAGEDEHQRSRERAGIEAPRSRQTLGDEALHVAGAAPVEPIALRGETQRLAGPARLSREGHDVQMAREDQSPRLGRAEPGDQVRLPDPAHLGHLPGHPEAEAVELVGEELRQRLVGPVADRVGLDQPRSHVVEIPVHLADASARPEEANLG